MPFHYVLTNLLADVPGAVGAIFLDAEGEAIEWVSRSEGQPYHLKVEGAYHAVIKRQLETASAAAGNGSLESYMLVGEHLATLTEVLPDGYYVVLVADRTSPLAMAGHHLRRAARAIADEI
jgi:predicted regulator of Ras-like GTPase activity (Roadblock/LC7/MglB family)